MDDTGKTRRDVRFSPDGNLAPSSGSDVSVGDKAGSLGKLLHFSRSDKGRRQRRKTKKSPQSVKGVRTVSGLEFLNRLHSKPRKCGQRKETASGIFLPENFPFGLTPVPITHQANFL